MSEDISYSVVGYILNARDESLRTRVSWFSWSPKRQLRSEGGEATMTAKGRDDAKALWPARA